MRMASIHNDRICWHHELAVGTGTGRRRPDHRFAKRVRKSEYRWRARAYQHQLNRLNVKFKSSRPLPRVFHRDHGILAS